MFSCLFAAFVFSSSLIEDVKRSYMIRNKLPGPYDDTVGPTILGIMLMISITAQFAIKLNSITK